jgi:hypothetical protein
MVGIELFPQQAQLLAEIGERLSHFVDLLVQGSLMLPLHGGPTLPWLA